MRTVQNQKSGHDNDGLQPGRSDPPGGKTERNEDENVGPDGGWIEDMAPAECKQILGCRGDGRRECDGEQAIQLHARSHDEEDEKPGDNRRFEVRALPNDSSAEPTRATTKRDSDRQAREQREGIG